MRFEIKFEGEIISEVELTKEFYEWLIEGHTPMLILKKKRVFHEIHLCWYRPLADTLLAKFKFTTSTARDIFFENYNWKPDKLFEELRTKVIEKIIDTWFDEHVSYILAKRGGDLMTGKEQVDVNKKAKMWNFSFYKIEGEWLEEDDALEEYGFNGLEDAEDYAEVYLDANVKSWKEAKELLKKLIEALD